MSGRDDSDSEFHPDCLDGLDTRWLGRSLAFHRSCASTNDLALDLLTVGGDHGALILSDSQMAGRGRRGRVWHSPAGVGIHGSMVLRPTVPVTAPGPVVASVGLGLAEGIERVTGLTVGIKWPNDLWIGDRKVAGILVEARGLSVDRPGFVAGFGLNVNHRSADFPPGLVRTVTSLALATGGRHDRCEVLRAVLTALEPRLDEALSGTAGAEFHEAYRARSVLIGRLVTLLDGDEPVEGVVTDLSVTEGLLVRTPQGHLRHVRAEYARDVRPL